MAYKALKSFKADGIDYNPGDPVPAEGFRNRRVLVSARWIKEIPDEEAGPDDPGADGTGTPAQTPPGGSDVQETGGNNNPPAGENTDPEGTPGAGQDGQEKPPAGEVQDNTPPQGDGGQGTGYGADGQQTPEGGDSLSNSDNKDQVELTAEQKTTAETIHGLSVEKLKKAISEITDTAVIKYVLELEGKKEDPRKTAQAALQERLETLTKGE